MAPRQGGGKSDHAGATNGEDVPAPTIDEVKDAIKQLKNNISARMLMHIRGLIGLHHPITRFRISPITVKAVPS